MQDSLHSNIDSLQVYIGGIRPYPGGNPSAIAKFAVQGTLKLTESGLEGDQQAETVFHGGPDRALCHYPREHYAWWARTLPEYAQKFSVPAFGENLSTTGLTEQTVNIGDIFQWGEALIQVTQPRSPCYKLNFHFALSDLSLKIQDAGRCGWLYRVIAPGMVASNAPFQQVSRVSEVSVAEAIAIAFHIPFDMQQYQRLLCAAGLSATWTRTLQKRRLSGKIEDSARRLWGK